MKHFKQMWTVIILTVLFSNLFFGCENESLEPEKVSVEASGNQNAILPYDFDWEDPNLNWMPYPANQPQISIPWTGAGSLFGVIPDDVLADRKKADGWCLVYSTFDPVVWNKNPYFMLYNKYRGLLRVYLYINDIQFAESSYMQDGLYVGNSSYKMLNFAEKEIVDASTNIISVDRVAPKPYNGAPLANNKWYFLQYEIAYDPSIVPTTSSNPPQFSFYANSINVTQVSLGGDLEATIRGTIGGSQTSAGQNIWNAATPGLKTLGTAGLSALGVGAINSATTNATTGANNLGVKKPIWKAVSAGMSSALSGATGNIPGAITGVLSAIIGGSSSSAGQTANLTLNGTLQLDGSQTGTGSLPSTPVSLYMPGSVATNSSGGYNVQGYVPLYNKSLGVFNLANKPTVTINKNKNPIYGGQYAYVNTYTIKPGTLNFLWNPIVNGQDATIENLKTEIVAVIGDSYKNTYGTVTTSARVETINGEYAVTKVGNSFTTSHVRYGSIPSYAAPKNVYIRVSFVVKPNDGSPETAIVKTFDVIQETYANY